MGDGRAFCTVCYAVGMNEQQLIAQLAEQEQKIRFASFDHDTGIAVGMALLEAARADVLPVAIDVSAWGQTVFHAALPGSSPDNDQWIARKRNVVHRFHKSSYRVGRELAAAGKTIDEQWFVDPMEFSPHGGCFPVRLVGSEGVIGTVTVSGLTQDKDHELVVTVLRTFTGD